MKIMLRWKKNSMKKNKGFTLVELLGVIILLGVIAIIITPKTIIGIKEYENGSLILISVFIILPS